MDKEFFKDFEMHNFESFIDKVLDSTIHSSKIGMEVAEDHLKGFFNELKITTSKIDKLRPEFLNYINGMTKCDYNNAEKLISREKMKEHLEKISKLDKEIHEFKTRMIEFINKI
jgi:hypothetical protein